ncbi:hypothetical protein P280DRAFT_466505 [Massarina eburnea CBS 473.64]|uniref:UBC core domain-containing protein n=1 Tax=Massarina eburnea CBS 473.64 TaxID=1395130 RepID=A0A6A6S860_9PLEO|nr:hypothetical protein P280DRAFT_466505 [Massarina eburnea CBS 473.64]
MAMHPEFSRRLFNDILEIQHDPYPNVHLHMRDRDITCACLILTPPNEEPMHLTIQFTNRYPLEAPKISIESYVDHPNVLGGYICASILNTREGWTPAYTLKGVLIQLLSFFMSDSIDQDHGSGSIDLTLYKRREQNRRRHQGVRQGGYECYHCGFNENWTPEKNEKRSTTSSQSTPFITKGSRSKLFDLPDEIILRLMFFTDTADLMSFAEAVPSIGHMLNSYDFIRMRELECFCLKKSFLYTKLGIGVSISGGRRPVFRSEFDLLSNEAFNIGVRKSVQGVEFENWLPLPLSRRHWKNVRLNAGHCLDGLRQRGKLRREDKVEVLYHFMNSVVVQFSQDADRSFNKPDARSTLSHVSEKAIESYFSLFHLLLCMATEDPTIVTSANRKIAAFLAKPPNKQRFPDLGHVLVAALISDSGLTNDLIFRIIKEAILRNVVWMLDEKGAAMAELAYLEPSNPSPYRLKKTFEASLTSYRLLMFLKLFSSAVRPLGKSLVQLRDELFDTHGAPPPGVSAAMARRIRSIRNVDSFPAFLTIMGIQNMPTQVVFSKFLKRTITDSVAAGYSRMPMTQSQLYMLRRQWEPSVEASKQVKITPLLKRWFNDGEKWYANGWRGRPSFFPQKQGT